MGLKFLFSAGKIKRFKDVTTFVQLTEEELEELVRQENAKKENERQSSASPEKGAKGAKAPVPDKKGKGNSGMEVSTPQQFPDFDPSNPNKNKATPHCVQIDVNGTKTMSEILEYFLHADSLGSDKKVSLILNDSQIDSHRATEIVDLSIGMGASHLLLSGCRGNEKFAKIQRFLKIQSLKQKSQF